MKEFEDGPITKVRIIAARDTAAYRIERERERNRMKEHYTIKKLEELLEILESSCIDDPEDILNDLVIKGPLLIKEVLSYRYRNDLIQKIIKAIFEDLEKELQNYNEYGVEWFKFISERSLNKILDKWEKEVV